MTVDVAFIDSRLVRYLRNRTTNPDAVYWTQRLGVHFRTDHYDEHCDSSTDTCWQLITSDDAQHLFLRTHDDRFSAILFRSRIVAVDPEHFRDSRSYEAKQSTNREAVAQESEPVRRYMLHGRTTYRKQQGPRPRHDPGASLGCGFDPVPPF